MIMANIYVNISVKKSKMFKNYIFTDKFTKIDRRTRQGKNRMRVRR